MNSFFATLQQLGPARLGIMGAILMGLLMFFVFISMRISTPEMKLLYSDLSSIDSGAVAAKLEESEIQYEISSDGSRIVVPGNEVGKARMLLAEAGLPNGGSLGYEIFDKQSSFGTTNFVQNINQIRALEGELARTIGSLESIRSARVHIVLPEKELFNRDTKNSSASVFLGIRPGAAVEKQQILSIQSLVASAVPNLKSANVSVVDSDGNLLAKGEDEDSNAMSMKADEMKKGYESRLENKIEEQVSRVVGFGKVTAMVTATMNFDQINTSEELYNPEGQVLRSSQTTQENSSETEASGKEVSVGNNLPGVGGDLLNEGGEPSANSNRTEEVSNFEISKTVRSTVRDFGEVEKVSVSILVDGTYETDKDGKKNYIPRKQEDLDKLASMIKTAIGFNEDRGDTFEITNLQFAQVDTDEEVIDERLLLGFEKSDLINAAELIVVSIMVILVVLLVLQPMVGKLMSVELQQSRDDLLNADLLPPSINNPALAAPNAMGQMSDNFSSAEEGSMIDIAGVEGKVKASTVKKVEEIVENYPNETVSVIRSWMSQEN